jgi:hypothetical protein
MTFDDPEGARLLVRLRVMATAVTLVLMVIVVFAEVVGPIIQPGYDVPEILLGTLVGTLLTLLGLVAIPALRSRS